MTSLRNSAFAALLLTGAALQPALAMPVANLSGLPAADVAAPEFTFGDQFLTGGAGRLDRMDALAAQSAAQDYFDFDALISLGALALAGGAMAGFAVTSAARRRAEEKAEPAWRDSVFRAVQADLAAFADTYRRAA